MMNVSCVITGDATFCIARVAEFVQRVCRHRTVNYATSQWLMMLNFCYF